MCVKRHKAYDNYFLLYKFVVYAFASIVDVRLYSDFFADLETEEREMVLGPGIPSESPRFILFMPKI